MIRRTFWLAAGAALGIAGYRRIERATRAVTTAVPPAVRQTPGRPVRALASGSALWAVRQVRAARKSGFVADVRAGMDEYLDQAYINRHGGRSRNTLVGQRAAIEPPHPRTEKTATD